MEQSYKEKYEQAIERLKQWDREHPCAGYVLSDRDKFIFPELAEFEDEKAIKEIIELVMQPTWKTEEEFHRRNVLCAWLENVPVTIDHEKREGFHLGYKACLEKQGEHANFRDKAQVGDRITKNEDGVLVNLSQLKRVAKPSEKQGEQKFEMKSAEESLGIDSDKYNKIIDECIFGEQKQEWSEEDEPQRELAESYLAKFDKKFPILPTLKGKRLADYKNFLNRCQQIFGLKYWGIRPIQAKLFEKLSLLWAAWGAEHLQGLGQTDGDMDDEISMWSEEDEACVILLDSICESSEAEYYDNPDSIIRKEIVNARLWLKSLRPQNKCAYNPYKAVVESIAEMCKHYDKASHSGLRDFYDNVKVKCKDAQEYDKMFPQNTWKPSDEQMEALDWQVENTSVGSWQYKATKELMVDLKKLKEGKV